MNQPGLRVRLGLCAVVAAGTAAAALPDFAPLASDEMRAHYVDVGQGAAVLLEFKCGTALIDTGGEKHATFDSTTLLLDYLDRYFARRTDLGRRIDLLVLTHAHIDHTRATLLVIDRFDVKNFVDNGSVVGEGGLQQKKAHDLARAGRFRHEKIDERTISEHAGRTSAIIDPINCSTGTDPRFHALWGKLDLRRGFSRTAAGNPNNSSVVMRLDFGSASFLFPGDLESGVHSDLLNFYFEGCTTTCPLDVDVLHVAHHAAENGTSVALMEAMKPRLAVISMGEPRPGSRSATAHGHPRIDSILRLLDVEHGGIAVSETRPERNVKIAQFSGNSQPKPGEPDRGPQFKVMAMKRAVYGTGWDGTVVVTARANGKLRVDIEK